MARKRLISPEFFTHGALYDAEHASGLPLRIAFAGLWTASDRRGLFHWKPRELKLSILPYDAVDFEQVLTALERAGFVQRYSVDGKEFGRIPSFERWQTFHKHEKASDIPEPTNAGSEPSKGRADTGTDGKMDVPSTAITGTVAVAVAGTSAIPGTTTNGSVGGGDDSDRERAHEFSIAVARAANNAIAARWGERPTVLHFSSAAEMAVEFVDAGVDIAVACAAIVESCKVSKKPEPPKTLAWFAAPIRNAHRQAEQRALNANDTPADKRGGAPRAIAALVGGSSAARRESDQRTEYDLARRNAGGAWATNPANRAAYAKIVEDKKAEYADWLDTAWGKQARDIEIVIACAAAAGFPTFDMWASTARDEQAGAA
jgi:hypothetical protein